MMDFTYLLKTANDFRKLAEEPYSKIFGDDLLSYILSAITPGRFKREEFSSYIQTNRTMLNQMKGAIAWKGKNEKGELQGIDRNNNFILLSKQPNPPKDYDTRSMSLLKGVGAIPTLYLYTMKEHEYKPKDIDYPKELGHYSFIMQAFLEMFPWLKTESNTEYKNNILEFVETNKAKIDRLRRQFDYEPTYMSSGSSGSTFAVGQHRILKLFKDHSEYQAAQAAMGRVFKGHGMGKTEAYIDDAGMLGTFYDNIVYYYIQERMVALNALFADDMDTGGYMGEILWDIKELFQKNKPILERLRKMVNHPRALDAVRMIANRMADKVKSTSGQKIEHIGNAMNERVGIRKDWLNVLIEDMITKYITGRTDLHAGNLGISNRGGGSVIYFDSAFREGKNRSDMINV
jgi:hypothetical protein